MPATGALHYCSCGHIVEQHSGGQKCRAESLNGWPCECPQLDLDDDGEAL